jgi:beta-1,4-N-acetylglucosaminyltransferase
MLRQKADNQVRAKKRVIFCFGEGGHTAQATRLFAQLKPFLKDAEIFTIGDFYEKPVWSDSHFYYPPLRDKVHGFTLSALFNASKSLKAMICLIGASATSGVISTGPGFCVVICAIARLFRKSTIHIETWSRFETQSLTGKLSYLVCKRFYVQNKEQLKFYKNAIYCGLL